MSASAAHAPTVVIENFYPCIEGGRHPIKRVVGEPLDLWCDIFMDGHVVMSAVVKWRQAGSRRWYESPMRPLENDRWQGQCIFNTMGRWEYAVEAWSDTFRGWKKTFAIRVQAQDPDVPVEALDGARLLTEAAARARTAGVEAAATQLEDVAELLSQLPPQEIMDVLLSDDLQALMDRFPDRSLSTTSTPMRVIAERERARFSAWYEFFPRSAEGRMDRHSTFRDCLPRLDDARAMGFDTIYFPPIHPIGITARKGKNNTLTAYEGDVGSPWAIGGPAGGHRDIEPQLGTMEDFVWLVEEASKRGLEIALDFAINCSPDHPYVKDHPDWFYQRPDGSIRYAENPPKKYQDIYPINFHCADWKNLWRELIDVVLFWVSKGVKIFRVDNPHTKPVSFWEELISTVHRKHPEVIFLAEAFTKPKMMQVLGKIGFTQSYTYFTWREDKAGLTEYARELMQGEMRWYYRGNFWPNTPDIHPYYLQNAPASMFRLRAALAATLSSTWGMYAGYELCENKPLPGKEEYLDSEKFQLSQRDYNAPGNIKGFIARLNSIRRDNPAMHLYDNLVFHGADHDQMLCYSKCTPDFSNRILCIVSLNGYDPISGMVYLDLGALGLGHDQTYRVRDLMHGGVYEWSGAANFVSLSPDGASLHIFQVEPL
ncbi:alpha-1,4-glucan--maltose-1-phosphate maltosyltransferase [Prosthecobacter sp. SYSU 5D2]|uniref:alpha-1,4-glucan--maltose-1-phosphate maltosyltransferase n=1 Tax=Prosthecobacter sp. SYSU 5D2 TaxID=3134134 RepID=UPI0031FEAB24